MTDQNVHPDAARWGGWSWRDPSGGEHFRRCSYCGSVHPGDLAAEDTWQANWADWKYGWPHKFYVDIQNRQPDQLYVLSSTNTPQDGFIAVDDLTDEQRAVALRDGWIGREPELWRYFQFATHSSHFGKFYSVHLGDSDLDAEVKRTIEQRSGIAFEFAEGRVAWRAAQVGDQT